MTHPEEVQLLLNHDFQERIAENIVRGLLRFIQLNQDESIPAG
jgi:N-acetylmuramoyl-L-alanine amidase